MTRRSEVSRTRDVLGLVAFVGLCFGVSVVGGLAARPAIADWYALLHKPAWTPPIWVFGPVWTLLYPMIAVAGWLAWREGRACFAPLVYLLQLALNLAWPWFFFAQRRPGLAFAVILLLAAAIVSTILAFWRIDRRAALLLVPYLAWVAFAATLNHAIWRMN
jgi:tryptophan-rich sensory protein